MSTPFLELERVDWRVLGALRCVDGVTGTPIERPLEVRVAGAEILRNRSGLYVIRRAAALADHEPSFEAPPALPAIGSLALALTVADPLDAYLPRRANLALPRDPDPANAGTAASLFRPLDLPLYPSPAAPLAVNWAVLRISLVAASGEHLGGALLRVLRNGNVLARGLTDWRGEALVPVAGVPVTTFSEDEDAVVITEIEVAVEAIFDPAAGRLTPAAEVRAGRPPASLPTVDPAALEAAAATLPRIQQNVAIAARRAQALSLSLTLP
jgi:hypothetical protein